MDKSRAVLAHLQSDDVHAVAAELRVLVTPSAEGEGFVAQGLEIDYTATGATEDEAREHFATGFVRTIHAMCKRGRDLGGLFKTRTPAEFWAKYDAALNQHVLRCETVHDLSGHLPDVPQGAPLPRMLRFATVN